MRLALVLSVMFLCKLALALDPAKSLSHYRQDSWTTQDGLPQVTVLSIAQDSEDYIWIATQVGVARFDGRSFDSYTVESNSGLANNYVNHILTLDDGQVWLATRGGLSVVKHRQMKVLADKESSGVVMHLAWLDGAVYAATDKGLLRLDPTQHAENLWLSTEAVDRVISHQGHLIFSQGRTLKRLEPDQSASTITNLPAPLTYLYSDRTGALWLGTAIGLWRWENGQLIQPFSQEEVNTKLIESVWHDADDNLWVATDAGWFRARYSRLTETTERLSATSIRSQFEDREGNFWVGSTTLGITRYWNGYVTRIGKNEGLVEPLIWGLYQEKNGDLWASTQQGVYRQSGANFVLHYPPEQLPDAKVLSVLRSRDGIFWVGTGQGLAAFNADRPVLEKELTPLKTEKVYSLIEYEDAVWIGTRGGLYRYEAGKLSTPANFPELPLLTIRGFIEDLDKKLWIGTSTGLYSYRNNAFTHVGSDSTLGAEFISAMYVDPSNVVWVGSQNSGLYRMEQGKWSKFSVDDGLYSNTIFYINSIGGKLWLTSHKGIFEIELSQFSELITGKRKKLQYHVFGESTRPDRAECNGGHLQAGLVDHLGRFLCPTIEGIARIDPSKLFRASQPPQLHIKELRYESNGVAHRTTEPNATLPPDAYNIEIDYVATSYREPLFTQYRYRLSTDRNVWVDAGSRITGYFYQLPPGNYEFEVSANTDDGTSARSNAKYPFRVLPYYYQTWWFTLLVAMSVLLIILSLLYWRYQLLRASSRQLELLVEQRTSELREANARLLRASSTDQLTQLGNRRYVIDRVQQDIALSRRAHIRKSDLDNRDIVFVMLDIDYFKSINDQYGHTIGDVVLSEVGRRIAQVIRDSDYAVRWGGEEFMIVGRCADHKHSMSIPERLKKAISDVPINIGEQLLVVTCSMGFAHYPFLTSNLDAITWEQIVTIADAALYKAKADGRNRWIGLEAGEHFEIDDLSHMHQFKDYLALIEQKKLNIISK